MDDFPALLSRVGTADLLDEMRRYGLVVRKYPSGARSQCPLLCSDKIDTTISWHKESQRALYFCQRCKIGGSIINLWEVTRGYSKAEAFRFLRGESPGVKFTPAVHAPPQEAQVPDFEVIWVSYSDSLPEAEEYLRGRGLSSCAELGLVRFDVGSFRPIAMQLRDFKGRTVGIQKRLVGPAQKEHPSQVCVGGSSVKRGFFGNPHDLPRSRIVWVAEGMADTLTLQVLAGDMECVVGAAGMGNLPAIAEQLELSEIDVSNKLFALFPQNDGDEGSLNHFKTLALKLMKLGADSVFIQTPWVHKDLNDWLRAGCVEWPPKGIDRQVFEAHKKELLSIELTFP